MYQPPERLLWPVGLPRPSFSQIKSAVLELLDKPGLELGTYYIEGNRKHLKRSMDALLAREIIAAIAKDVRNMSTTEIGKALETSTHSNFTSASKASWLMQSTAGTVLYNTAMEMLTQTKGGTDA